MKLHRFYIQEMHNRFGPISLGEVVWIHDKDLLNQWTRVLRFSPGNELVIFNDKEERLYKIAIIEPQSIKLEMITECERQLPEKKVYLIWSLLKKDKNDWVLQKATELGVHKLVPVVAERSEKLGFNVDRARKIVIEASEQCGRSDIPEVREPITIDEVLNEYSELPLYICEQHSTEDITGKVLSVDKVGLLIGPEGGWTDREKDLFADIGLAHIALSKFTLRAETASITGIGGLLAIKG